ncbi:MAG TPA: M28 family peptidase, partial [Polyangiaceae bacterium]|nr:M28 family peptidase [Polyangiaceae bacterium]
MFGALALLLLALLECCVWWRLAPSTVRPASSALQEFSAERAALVEGRLLGDLAPHPAGSPAQTHVRERLLAELRELGLKPEDQSGIACSYEGTCAELHNVIAVVPGTTQGTELGLVAHYDSVGAGPGAGDDGQGVASLVEIGRALRASPLTHGVALIFTDGEELGLLGARLFTHEHRLMHELRVVLNLEARGTRGPSLMFQATNGGGWLVRQLAAAPRLVASSVFGAVYRALPNDTDLTVFAQQGTQGLNFAFLGGVESYHTSRDLPKVLDGSSVQQQGDSALATLRRLDRHGLEQAGADAVYFDLASWLLVSLPVRWMLPAALLALLAFGLTLGRDFARDPSYGAKLGRAALALGLAWAVPVALAAALGRVLAFLGAVPSARIAQPLPVLVGLVSLVFGGQALALWISRSSEQRRALADVTWIAWLALGTALSLALPEASYVAVLPALCAAALRLLIGPSSSPRAGARACLCAALVASLLWLPLLTLLPSVLGLTSPALLTIALCIGLSPFAPVFGGLLGGGRSALVLCLGGMVALLCQLAWSPYSERVPQRLSLLFEQDADGMGRWLADANGGRLPRALFGAAAFTPVPAHPHPWPAYGQALTYAASANLP